MMTPNALMLLNVGDEVAELDAVGNVNLASRAIVTEVERVGGITYVYTDSDDYRCYPYNSDTGAALPAEWGATGRETVVEIVKLV